MTKRIEGGSSPLREAKYKAHPAKLEAKKRRRRAKWERDRKRWAEDEGYQARQVQRAADLRAKEEARRGRAR